MGDDEVPSENTLQMSEHHQVGKSCEQLDSQGSGKRKGLEIEALLASAYK